MSTKHNCPHPGRNKSNYKNRLLKRGLSKAPTMTPVETLRRLQEKRETETGFPWWTGHADTPEETLLKEIFTA